MKKAAALALLVFFLQSCGGGPGPTLAEVDGRKITASDFRLKAALYGLKISGEQEARDFLNLLVNDAVIIEQAKKDRIKVTSPELKAEIEGFVPGFSEPDTRKALKKMGIKFRSWKRDIEEKVIRKKEINFAMRERIKIEESDLKDYFWTNILEFRRLKKIRARQIVLDTEEKAREVVKLAREGLDFAELAKKHSVTSEAETGGDLGFFSPGEMPKFINDAVAGLKAGEISLLVKSPYGWHILKVEEVMEAETPKFEEVRTEVLERCFEAKKDEYFGVWMEETRKKHAIKMHEEALKKFVKEELS